MSTAVDREKAKLLGWVEDGPVQFAGIIGSRAAQALEAEGLVSVDWDGPPPTPDFPGGSGVLRKVSDAD